MFSKLDAWSFLYKKIDRRRPGLLGAVSNRMFRRIEYFARKFNADPMVRVDVADAQLLMPWSHNLPRILKSYPNYESELGRLASYLSRTDGKLCMIDVGANIGDTVATVPASPESEFLCIEGSARYFEYLKKNVGANANVRAVLALLGEHRQDTTGLSLREVSGTAFLDAQPEGVSNVPWMALDDVLIEHDPFQNANLLKVDTDGFDLHVLRGSTKLLKRGHPCVYIEVSPRHWRDFGGSEPLDGMRFLHELGYEEVLIYDSVGYLIGRDCTSSPQLMNALTQYAYRKPSVYFNLVAFHSSRPDVESFYSSELNLNMPI
jgi:FkbM family methyltransferase